MKNRDERLTEVMGYITGYVGDGARLVQGVEIGVPPVWGNASEVTDFSSWNGFGKLWEWVEEQEWFPDWNRFHSGPKVGGGDDPECVSSIYINPEEFASAVDEYLQGRES